MVKKTKKYKRTQTNYINNHHSLVNIEQLNLENAFWSGLMIGALGVITTLWLMSDKSEKKETECKQ
jgi:hypothetical protein